MAVEREPSFKYDRVRCRTCGWPWRAYTDEQGRIHAGHPPGLSCSRNRPVLEGDKPEDAVVFGTVIEMASKREPVLTPHVEVAHPNGRSQH